MNKPKISVIVPVYNAEKWLRRCVDSILAQTYTDFELLLVDDGSTDISGAICDEYATLDPRVRPFHKPNGGVSSARNLSIENAKGEWITFVDSDDLLYPDSLMTLMEANSSDLVVGLLYHRAENKFNLRHVAKSKHSEFVFDLKNSKKTNFFEFEQELVRVNIFNPLAKLFRTNIILSENIKFNEQLFFGEDSDFVIRYITKCQQVCIINTEIYEYVEYASMFFKKYKMNASQYFIHATAIQNACRKLQTATNYKFSIIENTILANLGYVYLASIFKETNYFDFMVAHVECSESNINPYLDSKKKKIFFRIFKNHPKFAYILTRFSTVF